jgi:hypothetical protein
MSIEKDVEGWLASDATDKLADYAGRGRKHRHLSDEDLLSGWLAAFKLMADDVRDYERRAVEQDYNSEFFLRKKEPPYDLIREDFERYIAETSRAIEDLKRDDPAKYEEIARSIDADIKHFRSSRDQSKN